MVLIIKTRYMKSISSLILNLKFVGTLLLLSLFQTAIFAQDGGGADVNVKITKETETWYTQPWVWIVGGAVFILLLVALLRGNSNKS
jgi:hypothetical protein